MNLKDVQNGKPRFEEKIDKVGVKGINIPIKIRDRTNNIQNTVAKVEMSVCLPHYQRGTHMSRFTETLHISRNVLSLDSIKTTLAKLKEVLKADTAYIKISFPYFIEKVSPVSKLKSLMNYDIKFVGNLNNKRFTFILIVRVPIMTLCPCSKEISEKNAHNQRAYATIEIETNSFVWIEDIVVIAENAASSPIYTILKRSDEKYVTEHSYENPKFVEDVVREISDKLKKQQKVKRFKVEVESIESIHNHSAYAMIEYEKKSNRN
jgi:GTP cyclohydrolase I